jgi:hypothetical protein
MTGSAVGFALAFVGKLLGVASVVYVNGKRSYRGATVRPGDAVKTGGLSEAAFVVGLDVFMLRQHSEMRLLAPKGGSNRLAAGLRLITCGLLPVIEAGGAQGADGDWHRNYQRYCLLC